MRTSARRCPRSLAVCRLPLRLLLHRLPGVRALSRAAGRARRCRRHRYFPNGGRARETDGGDGRCALPYVLRHGASLVCRLLPDSDRQHRCQSALSGRCAHSFLHEWRGWRPFARRGAWPGAMPHLPTLCHGAAPGERAAAAIARRFFPPRVKGPWLVGARARSAKPALR